MKRSRLLSRWHLGGYDRRKLNAVLPTKDGGFGEWRRREVAEAYGFRGQACTCGRIAQVIEQ